MMLHFKGKVLSLVVAITCAIVMLTSFPVMASETDVAALEGNPSTVENDEINSYETIPDEETGIVFDAYDVEMQTDELSADEKEEANTDVLPTDEAEETNTDVNLTVSTEEEPEAEAGEPEEEPVPADVYPARSEALSSGNHIYFYNIEGGVGSSDMILLETNGRWGLIDAGHRYENTITDESGKNWSANYSGLSCQVAGKYGLDAMKYMVETLGVDHLDFIIATHSHSDHIGGIPEIVNLTVGGEDGSVHSLIDDTTVYFYKTYHHTGAQDDDIGPERINTSWHNQAYYYQSKQAVASQDGQLVDISCGISASDGKKISANQSENLSIIKESGNFSGVTYQPRSATNPYDDRISFQWGDMKIDLYHLFAVSGAKNENVNSIVTVLTCDGHKIYLAGDMDTTFRTEQKLAKVIAGDYGHFNLVKMSHHGIYDGSNSKDLIDSLQPQIMISTNHWTNLKSATVGGIYSSVKYYAAKNYGTAFYGTGMSDRMLGVKLDGRDLSLFNVTGVGEKASVDSADGCKDSGKICDGWSQWQDEIYSANVYRWFYFINNKAVTGWKQIDGKWYHFASDGFMDHGWYQENGKYYYLDDNMKSGWQKIDGEWYYFNTNGVMAANAWAKDSVGWCWLGSDGKQVKSKWVWDGGSWYYIKSNGYMAANEWAKDSIGWCWLGSNGKQVKSKWVWDGGSWYYIKSNGYMAANEWAKDSKGWCFLGSSGKQIKDKWIKWKGSWYYIKSNGYMAVREYASDSMCRYWMGGNGKIVSKSRK